MHRDPTPLRRVSTTRRLVRFGVGVLTAGTLAACTGTSDAGTAAGQPPRSAAYVALGDSYSAAPLNPEVADAACLRSTNNYPSRLARALSVPLTDVTCAGATTDDVRGEQTVPPSRGGGTVAPQIEAVGPQTDLVTIGLGGNDGGLFVTMVDRCLSPDSSVRSCLDGLAGTGDDSDFRRAGRAVREVVADVRREAARDVTIVLVDYPRFVTSARPCAALPGVPQESLAAVANAQRLLNRTLAQAADASGALFLDLEVPSEQHDLCSADSWVNGGRTDPGLALRWHPVPPEQAAVARLLRRLLASDPGGVR